MPIILIFTIINPLASPNAGASPLKYGDVNTETTSPGEVKGLIIDIILIIIILKIVVIILLQQKVVY